MRKKKNELEEQRKAKRKRRKPIDYTYEKINDNIKSCVNFFYFFNIYKDMHTLVNMIRNNCFFLYTHI